MNSPNIQHAVRPVKVGFPLGFAIFVLPIVFAWVTLMKGYSTTARVLSFLWLGVCTLFWMLGLIGASVVPDAESPNRAVSGVGADDSVVAAAPEKTPEELAADREAELQREYARDPEKALTLDVSGVKGGFETVLILSGTVSSVADFEIKDVEIVCDLFANSGTRVGRVTETLYEVVPAKGSKRFSELNMGFMGGSGQVATFDCRARRASKV